jgi:hypothetical protein
MPRALQAGVLYYGLIFALGFALGALRVLVVAPATGEVAAVLLELPLMLGASWSVARALVARQGVTTSAGRLLMGSLAFALLMASEVAMAVAMFGQPLRRWASDLTKAPGALGLAGQVAFGLIPLLLPAHGGSKKAA